MSRRNAEILLAAVVIARSMSYLFNKIAMETMDNFTLLGIRFLIAGLVLAVIFYKKLAASSRKTLLHGAILGFGLFWMMAAELVSLRTSDTSTVAILESTSIIFVPIFESILRKALPSKSVVASTLIAFTGAALLNVKGSGLTFQSGAFFAVISAAIYACCLIMIDRMAKNDDPIVLGAVEVLVMGVLGLIAAFLFETPRMPSGTTEWVSILFLAIVCSSFGYAIQPLCQKYTTSERVNTFSAINPVSASAFGILFLGESLGTLAVIGSVLVLTAVYIQNRNPEAEPGSDGPCKSGCMSR